MTGLYSWEADQAVAEARRAQDEAADAYDAQLRALLQEYAGRRSAAAQLVRHVADLAVGYAAEADRRAQATLDTAINASTGGQRVAIERLEEQLEKARDSSKWAHAQLDEKRQLREERQAEGEEVKVTIARSLGGWQVGDLEEIAYRLRCGGATDDTPVKVSEYTAAALVPAPNLVPLTRTTRVPPPPERPPVLPNPTVVEQPWLSRGQVFVGVVAALVAVVMCIVIGAVL